MMDTIELDGLTFRVDVEPDHDMRAPWEERDGHGPVRKIRDDCYRGRPVKRPGERVLTFERSHGYAYDMQGAMRIALADRWGVANPEGMTRRQIAAAAVENDYQRLRAWCNDEWHWCGVVVTLLDVDGRSTRTTQSLWGFESDSPEYHDETAHDLASEIATDLGRRKYVETGATRQRVRA